MSFVKYPPTNIAEAIDVIEQDSEIFHNIVHGDENTEVLTENGLVPSVDKVLKDINDQADNVLAGIQADTDNVLNNFQADADAAIAATGWFVAGDFTTGFTFTARNQVGRDASGEFWSYNGTLPFTVAAGTVPSTPTYTQRGDAALRSALAAPDSTVLVGGVEAGSVGWLSGTVINVKRFGAIGDANFLNPSDNQFYVDSDFTQLSNDDTVSIQAALDVNVDGRKVVFIPNGNYLVNAVTKIRLRSDTTLIFGKDAKFIAKTTNWDIYSIIDIVSVENVAVINAQLVGDRYRNTKTTEGAGHGFSIRMVKNLKIENAHISDCFTDGVYINNLENGDISFVVADNNRRQGLSLISGKNIHIYDSEFNNTNGTSPECGIDIEPNEAFEFYENVVFDNIRTKNNAAAGFLVNLNKLNDASREVSITVNNFQDEGSRWGVYLTAFECTTSEHGFIEMNSPRALNNTDAGMMLVGYKANATPKVTLNRPYVYNPNTNNGTNQRSQDVGISVHSETSNFPVGTPIGNVDIINPSVLMAAGRQILRGIFVGFNEITQKVKIIDPLQMDIGSMETVSNNNNRALLSFLNSPDGTVIVKDRFQVLKITTPTSLIRNFNTGVHSLIESTATGGTTTLNEYQRFAVADDLTVVKVNAGGSLVVNLPTGFTFIDETGSIIAGSSYTTSNVGAILRFIKLRRGVFKVAREFGTWV